MCGEAIGHCGGVGDCVEVVQIGSVCSEVKLFKSNLLLKILWFDEMLWNGRSPRLVLGFFIMFGLSEDTVDNFLYDSLKRGWCWPAILIGSI
jgi:hypothetical protein